MDGTESLFRESSEFLDALSKQPRPPKKIKSIDYFRKHWPEIESSRANGYSFEAIAETLEQFYKRDFPVGTVRRYFSLMKKEAAKTQKPLVSSQPVLPERLEYPQLTSDELTSADPHVERFTKTEALV